jgi:nicotinate phosphoribosyltransferase
VTPPPDSALLTDFYQLTMAAGYVESGKAHEIATFDLFVRRLPPGRDYLIAAGLEQALSYLENLRFRPAEIAWLKSLPQFSRVSPKFWSFLRNLRFTGDVFAMPEGTPVYPNEPILSVRAPLPEAQIAETFLLATVGFQTMIATKASLVRAAAGDRLIVEFGTRRAHSPYAGVLAARAAFVGGCDGTSNALAAYRFGIPVFGTAAHSWVLSFHSEREAFARLQALLGERCVHLVDTHDTIQGTRVAASLGRPLWGVRLDSGDLLALSREARRILDDAGLPEARIMATNDLDERRIASLVASGAPIDAFGVGTALATSLDSPALGVVYKLVELESPEGPLYPAKHSEGKRTIAGAKQVFRYGDFDVIGRASECKPEEGDCEPLLGPAMLGGRRVSERETLAGIQERTTAGRPFATRGVRLSNELEAIQR